MKRLTTLLLTAFLLLHASAQELEECDAKNASPAELLEKKQAPYEYMFAARNYPDFEQGYSAYEKALYSTKAMLNSRATPTFNLSWLVEGPFNIGGRVNCIAIHPTNKNIMYVGLSDGGVFKTIDRGTNWLPVFDNQTKLSIGDIYIDPHNPNVVYVGTGDPNISGFPAIGDGVYRSINGGTTWTYLGLNNDKIVSKVEVHPTDSNLLFCSTMGIPFYKTNDRGLYRSTDRGATWSKILFLSDSTGVIDFEVNPTNPSIIYAAAWTRIRNNHEGLIQGIESGVYKTVNGGANWTKLSGGLPYGVASRVTIEMSKQNPNKLYALIVDTLLDVGGIYMSTNAGATWSACARVGLPDPAQGNFGWYFDGLKINPFNDNSIYVLGVDLYGSNDAGATFSIVAPEWWTYAVHADKHDLAFVSQDSFYLATDGGLYRTEDFGNNWTADNRIPNTEFYHITVNPHVAKQYAGGAQDNGTCWGTSLDVNWPRVYGGDGFDIQFDPNTPMTLYAETQNGGLVSSNDGGNSFNDIGVLSGDRTNWDQPYIVSKHHSNVMYTGTYMLYKNTIAPDANWTPISNDLTDGIVYDPRFHNISTIAESPFRAGMLYVGTSDANVWRSDNDGQSWLNIGGSLPNRYVTRIVPSKIDSNTVFICQSGYKDGDNIPHVHVSHNKGASWIDISGNLPPLGVNDIETISATDSILFVANDGGIYYTKDYGADWERLGNNMPLIWVYDIELDVRNSRLIAGTFARSIQSIAVDSILNTNTTVHAQASSSMDTICVGDLVLLNASGGTAYQWTPSTNVACSTCASTSASPTSTTTYKVRVSSGANFAFDSVTIVVHPVPNIPVVTNNHDTLFAVGPGPYQWYKDGVLISGATKSYLVTLDAGVYNVQVSNVKGCHTMSSDFFYSGIWGVAPLDEDKLQIFYNPAEQNIKLSFISNRQSAATMDIYNMQGELVMKKNVGDIDKGKNEKSLSKENISSGVYMIDFTMEGISYRKKLVVY